MSDHPEDGLDDLGRAYVGDWTMPDTVAEVCSAAVDQIEPADHAGIAMVLDGRVETSYATDRVVEDVDRAGGGPWLEAIRLADAVVLPCTESDERFSAFSAAALGAGIRSVVSVPLQATGRVQGALSLYSRTSGAFGDAEVDTARSFGAQVSAVLANADAYWEAGSVAEGLRQAMVHRAAIEQAKGIVAEASGCTLDEAFELLVERSQLEQRKLREVAEEVVGGEMGRSG